MSGPGEPNWPVGPLQPTTVAPVGLFPKMFVEGTFLPGIERTARIKAMLRQRQEQLNLTDWDIRYDPSREPAPDREAEVDWMDHSKVAVITLQPYLDYQAAELAVTHELLHLAIKPYVRVAERLLAYDAVERSRVVLTEMLEEAEEEIIETISRALVPAGPRAAWPPEKDHIWAVFKP